MPANDKVISTLNSLIETLKDGEQGFRTAAEGVKTPATRTLFDQIARERTTMVSELQAEVRRLGGDPERGGSMSGSLHRGWINIKSLVTGQDEGAIVAEAERGEDVAVAVFDGALKADLPVELRALVQRQYAKVKQAHDRVRDLERVFEKR